MPAGPQRRTPPQERHAFGLTILAPSHPEVRRLQHTAVRPSLHGQKIWPTSFVLLDYTYCMPLRCVTQPIVVSIASNHHPVSRCPVEEAKRWHGRGHNGERRC